MDKKLYEKYADKLLEAMKAEKLMNKEVAEIFSVPASYMSDMRKHPEKVTDPFMEKIRAWSISGKPLREYKLPQAPDTEAAAINQQEVNKATIETSAFAASMKRESREATKQLVKEHKAAEAAEVREALHEAIQESVNTEEPLTKDDLKTLIRNSAVKEPTKEEQAKTFRYRYEQVHKVDPSKLDKRTGVLASAEIQILPDGSLHITCTYK